MPLNHGDPSFKKPKSVGKLSRASESKATQKPTRYGLRNHNTEHVHLDKNNKPQNLAKIEDIKEWNFSGKPIEYVVAERQKIKECELIKNGSRRLTRGAVAKFDQNEKANLGLVDNSANTSKSKASSAVKSIFKPAKNPGSIQKKKTPTMIIIKQEEDENLEE